MDFKNVNCDEDRLSTNYKLTLYALERCKHDSDDVMTGSESRKRASGETSCASPRRNHARVRRAMRLAVNSRRPRERRVKPVGEEPVLGQLYFIVLVRNFDRAVKLRSIAV